MPVIMRAAAAHDLDSAASFPAKSLPGLPAHATRAPVKDLNHAAAAPRSATAQARPSFFRRFTAASKSSSAPQNSKELAAPSNLALSPSASSGDTPSLTRSLPSHSSAEVLEPVPTRASQDAAAAGDRTSSQSLREKKSDWALYMAAITEADSRRKLPSFPSMGARDPAPRMAPVPLAVLSGEVEPPTVRQSTRPAKPRGPAPQPVSRGYAEPAGLAPRPRDMVNAPPPRRSDSPTSRSRSAPRDRHSVDDLHRSYGDSSPERSFDESRTVREEQRASRELRQRISASDMRRRMESESPRRTDMQQPSDDMAASRSLPRDVLMSSIVGLPPPPGVIAHARRDDEPRHSGPPRMPLPEAPRPAPPRSHPLAEAQAQSRPRPSPSRAPRSAPRMTGSDSRPASAGPSTSQSRSNGPPEPHPLAKRGPAHASTSQIETPSSHPSSGFAALSSYAPPPPSALDGVKLADIVGPNAPAYNKSSTSLQAQRIEDMKKLNKLNTTGPRVAPPSRRSPLSSAPVTGAGARSAVSSYGAQIKTNKADGGRKLHKSVRAPMDREPRQILADSARYVGAGEDHGL